jgi:hypothetical protein
MDSMELLQKNIVQLNRLDNVYWDVSLNGDTWKVYRQFTLMNEFDSVYNLLHYLTHKRRELDQTAYEMDCGLISFKGKYYKPVISEKEVN